MKWFMAPEHWRHRAEEARILAATLSDLGGGEAREIILRIAADYDQLARLAHKMLMREGRKTLGYEGKEKRK